MRQVDIDELAVRIAQASGRGVALVDVREPMEYAEGHVPGALSIPMGRLPARSADLDRTNPLYVICRSGNRSAAMVDLLTGQGFEAYNVAGGTQAWVASGRPIEN